MEVNIEVNHVPIRAKDNETILTALNNQGINVPTLCHLNGLHATGSCRICVVEVEGAEDLIPSCSHYVSEGMKIHTHSPKVIKARRTLLELLLARHPGECCYCTVNGRCELQALASQLNINEKRFRTAKMKTRIDQSSCGLVFDPSKCILCGRCVRTCEEITGVCTLGFISRGATTSVSTAFNKAINLSSCILCGQCILNCPTAALHEKDHISQAMEMLNAEDLVTTVIIDPAVAVTIWEDNGSRISKDMMPYLAAALKKAGFNFVFDAAFTADLYCIELAAELKKRLEQQSRLPLITGNCPGWVKYAEQFLPRQLELLPRLSSPQEMMGILVKTYLAETEKIDVSRIRVIALAPCPAKKFEASRESANTIVKSAVDLVLTGKEISRLITLSGINMQQIEPSAADAPFHSGSSAGRLTAVAGGTAEAILRSLTYNITGSTDPIVKINKLRGTRPYREYQAEINGRQITVAVVSGLSGINKLIKELEQGKREIHLIEIMACPGGCIAGGGLTHHNNDVNFINTRIRNIYDADDRLSVRIPDKNPLISKLYETFLPGPGTDKSELLFKTSYNERTVLK